MRLIVSSNTMPAMTAASFFRPSLRYSAPRSRSAYANAVLRSVKVAA
jgi:hypothetical protein